MALDKVKVGVMDGASTGVKSDRHTIPSVTTSQRDAGSFNAAVGDIIYNSTIGNLQQYTVTGWASVAAPPSITSITYPTESGAVLTALDASGSSDAAQTLIINGSNFTSSVTVEIQVSGSFVAFASSTSVNGARNQVTCTGVTKRAAADGYTLRVTNSTGLDASTTVNFNADPSFSTAANLGSVYAGLTLNKSIAFTGTKVIQGATAKPTWMTVTGNSSTADNGSGDTTFDATGSPAVLAGTIANSGTTQTHTFSIIVRDAENQTFNRDFSLTAVDLPTGGTNGSGSGTLATPTISGVTYRYHAFLSGTSNFQVYANTVCDILIVGGGGGSGYHVGGGGGAGGVVTMMNYTISTGTASVTVGAGGQASNNGGSSSIVFPASAGTQTVLGGGHGGGWSTHEGSDGANGGGDGINNSSSYANNNGGQGQSATLLSQSGATITYFGGNDGGHTANYYNQNNHPSGGGGGATANGVTPASSTSTGGNGGAGKQITWVTPDSLGFTSGSGSRNGTAYNVGFYFAGGGGGSIEQGTTSGNGGIGGGGPGGKYAGTEGTAGSNSINPGTGTNGGNGNHGGANTGGGAGGNYTSGGNGCNGGSGIVVIRYAI